MGNIMSHNTSSGRWSPRWPRDCRYITSIWKNNDFLYKQNWNEFGTKNSLVDLLMGESRVGFKSGLRIGDESIITVNNELLVEPDDKSAKGGDRVGLEYKGGEYSVPGTVGSLALLLLRIMSPSFSLHKWYYYKAMTPCFPRLLNNYTSISYLVNVRLLFVVLLIKL